MAGYILWTATELAARGIDRAPPPTRVTSDRDAGSAAEVPELAQRFDSDADDDTAGAVIRHVRDHVRYVVVDEYQNTNPIQEKLIERRCQFGANLCVVGYEDPTIYQWRGSAASHILTFTQRQAGVRTVTLDDNFRSSPGIVALGRDVVDDFGVSWRVRSTKPF